MCEWTNCAAMAGKLRPSIEPLPSTSSGSASSSATNELHPLTLACEIEPLPLQRFTFATDEQLTDLAKGIVPANTTRSTQWALRMFEDWKQARNERFKSDPVPENLLLSEDPAVLNTHLSRFVVEARKVNGEHYPPSTIY